MFRGGLGFDPKSDHVKFVVDWAALVQFFPPGTSVSPAKQSADCSTLIIIQGWSNRPVVASVIVDSAQLRPKNEKKNIMFNATLPLNCVKHPKSFCHMCMKTLKDEIRSLFLRKQKELYFSCKKGIDTRNVLNTCLRPLRIELNCFVLFSSIASVV
jgi:hypothetical protein